MAIYKAPLRDMRFILHECLQVEDEFKKLNFEDVTADLVDAILEEGAKVCEEVLFPINRSGDEEGCTYENGVVRTPSGFKDAYKTYTEGGWTGLTGDPEFGGQGLPATIGFVINEMVTSTNLSFGMYPGLTHGAIEAIHAHGTDELKTTYLEKMMGGTWSGTMCLTEPQCGTDLGLIRTKAEPAEDGTYEISGTKIFISAGEHDLTENIVHLVLAKLPDAPEGVKGISLFVVPKFLPDDQGEPGQRNGVMCGSIEHKMGIKASSTCVMNFDAARGWLVGEPHKGLRCMFTMMNAARLGVGIQGLGVAETALQSSVDYALDRTQGRALDGAKEPEQAADPIIVHPDVRRMLMEQKAMTEGARALAYWVGLMIDQYRKTDDDELREHAEDLVSLLTPVVKAFLTDMGFNGTATGMQVLGGHGYIREWGMEQLVRDARIAQIYEGTNGIQALDLVGRKMPSKGGGLVRRYFAEIEAFLKETKEDAEMQEFTAPLAGAFKTLNGATMWLAQNGMQNPNEAGGAAVDYLKTMGYVTLGFMWAKMAKSALAAIAAGSDDPYYKVKLETARFYMTRLLPMAEAHANILQTGVGPLMALDREAFRLAG